MQIVSNASTQPNWKQAFQDAVFELDPTRLQPKLERRRGPSKTGSLKYFRAIVRVPRELMELEDAKRTIRYLARHELQA